MQRTLAVLPLFAALSLVACGGGGSGNQPPAPPPPPPPAGITLISGSEAALVSAVLTQMNEGSVAAQDVSGNFLLTRMLVMLTPTATVGQVNAAARVIGATA